MNISDRTQQFFTRAIDSNQNGVSRQELQRLDSNGDGRVDEQFANDIAPEDLNTVEEALRQSYNFSDSEAIVFPPRGVTAQNNPTSVNPVSPTPVSQADETSAPAGPDFRAERERIGTELATILDQAQTMTQSQYDRTMTSRPTERANRGYFAQIQSRLGEQGASIDRLIAQSEAQQPRDPVEHDRLLRLRELSFQSQQIYGQLSVAHNPRDRFGDAAAVISRIAAAQQALGELGPEGIGAENYDRIGQQLEDYSAVALSFPAMAGQGEADTMLDAFTMQTFQRLRQIQGTAGDGHRERPGETPDVAGALNSFRNDVTDMRTFMTRFRQLEGDLAAGRFASPAEFQAAMRAAVPRTSPAFQTSVDQLAQSKWNMNQADISRRAATASYAQARTQVQAAYGELQAARQNLSDSGGQIEISQTALQRSDLTGARAARDQAVSFQRSADTHLNRYRELRAGGEANAQEAENHRRLAMGYLATAESLTNLVRQGPYAEQLRPETDRLDTRSRELRSWSAQLQDDIGVLRDNLRQMDTYHRDLSAWSQGLAGDIQRLDGNINLEDLRQRTAQMAEGGINNASGRMATLLQGYNVSENARNYLQNPASLPEGERGNVREELTNLFREHPGLARAVAQEMSSLRSEFAGQRQDIQRLFGADSPQMRALDLTEYQLVNGWMQRNGLMVEALIAAGNGSPEVQGAIDGTMTWFRQTQDRFDGYVHTNRELRAEAVRGFDDWMRSQPEVNARYEEVRQQYKEPVDRVPVSLHVDQTGRTMTFNAYVFRDGDRFKVLNPLDSRVYEGTTQREALAAMARESRMANGTLRYHDGERLQQVRSTAPTDTFLADVGMGVVGVAGFVLLAAPEPTTLTKWGGAALVGVSGTYFAAKGTARMIDLYQHETLGMNAETAGAALDIASGVLMFARGGGLLARAASNSESAVVQTFNRLGQSAGLTGAEYATFAAGATLAGQQFYQGVIRNPELSDSERLTQGGKMVLALTLPLAVAPAARLGQRLLNTAPETIPITDIQAANQAYSQRLTDMETRVANIRQGAGPEALSVLRSELGPVLELARRVYESPAMRRLPQEQQAGLQRIQALEAIRDALPEAQVRPAGLSAEQAEIIQADQSQLVGTPTNVTRFPNGRRQVESSLDITPGLNQAQARTAGRQRMTELAAQMAAADGLTVRPGGRANQLELVNAEGAAVKRLDFENNGSGQIRITDLGRNLIEIARINSPAQAVPTGLAPQRMPISENAAIWNEAPNQSAGIPTPAELTRVKGTDTAHLEDFRNVEGLSIEALVARVPRDATLRELTPRAQGTQTGFEYSWRTINSQGEPSSMTLRIHGPDNTVAAGANASRGWVAVIEKGGGLRQDGAGTFYPSSQRTEYLSNGQPNPNYVPRIANITHIPLAGNPALRNRPNVVPVPGEERREPTPVPQQP